MGLKEFRRRMITPVVYIRDLYGINVSTDDVIQQIQGPYQG